MISRIIFIFLFLSFECSMVVYGLDGQKVQREQEFFPFLGEITSNKTNIRAGQSANFESLCKLQKGDEIIVLGRKFSWYKVRLPQNANSFISKKYVRLSGRDAGKVTANRVNVRAGAGGNFTALGQVSKGTKVRILGKENEWYKIEPVENSIGWIHEELVTFKSNDISLTRNFQEQTASMIEKKEKEVKEPLPEEEANPSLVTLSGVLKQFNDGKTNDIQYKVVTDHQHVFLIQGFARMLDEYLDKKVQVEGVQTKDEENHQLPVIAGSSIHLIY